MSLGSLIHASETSWLLDTLGATDADACYMSGSLLDGFGNPRSDIDIFFVTASVENLRTREVAPFARFRGSERALAVLQPDALRPRFDIECQSWASVEKLAARVESTGDPLMSLDDAYGITYDELDFLHRMKIGRSLNGDRGLDRLRALFDLTRLPELLASRRLADYERQAEDALGALEGGQLETAFACGRGALEAAFDAFL